MLARYRFNDAPNYRRVLMIDYDPQFNLSQAFLPSKLYFQLEEQRKTTLAILVDDDSDINQYEIQVPGNHKPPSASNLTTELINYNDNGCLHIIPSTLNLMYIALGQATEQIKPIEERFTKFINECRQIYDLIIIDCHPAGSIFTRTSLTNSDAVLIPVAPEKVAARGIGLMLNFIQSKKLGPKGPTPHILFNRMPRFKTDYKSNAIETAIRTNPKYGNYCLENTLKKFTAFSDPEEGRGFVWNSTKPYSTEAHSNLMQVAKEFSRKISQ